MKTERNEREREKRKEHWLFITREPSEGLPIDLLNEKVLETWPDS